MKPKSILTEISKIVNQKSDSFYWLIIIILVALLFYMIGWISRDLEEQKPIEIEDFSKITEIGDF